MSDSDLLKQHAADHEKAAALLRAREEEPAALLHDELVVALMAGALALRGQLPVKHHPAIEHGVNCYKVPHFLSGYLHSESDDGPYDVDCVFYCGRCHSWLPL